MFISGIMKSLI